MEVGKGAEWTRERREVGRHGALSSGERERRYGLCVCTKEKGMS